jgi:hypothetical protein
LTLPLSRNLLPVAQFNVMRATATNIRIIGLDTYISDDCIIDWQALPTLSDPTAAELADKFVPTTWQLSVPHQRWIDILPHPRMRDNGIRAQGTFEAEDLKDDLLGYLCGDTTQDDKGLRVVAMLAWADLWRPEGSG